MEWPSLPPLATLARSVAPVIRSWTKTSSRPFASPGTRLGALLTNATNRPSGVIEPRVLLPFACAPLDLTLTRLVRPATATPEPSSMHRAMIAKRRFLIAAGPPDADRRPLPRHVEDHRRVEVPDV